MGIRIPSDLNSIAASARRGLYHAWQEVRTRIGSALGPTAQQWWHNPLLHRERLERPFPWRILSRVILVVGFILMLLAVVAWLITERALGVAMLAFPLGAILLTLALTPLQGVVSAASHFQRAAANPRQMSTADPSELVWGMALVAMWRLRWVIAVSLAMTPALIVSILHVDISTYSNYRDSVLALGSAAPIDQVQLLGPNASIPLFRILVRAMSIGLVPYVLIPLLATFGVTAALVLRERLLGLTLSLIASVVALLILGALGQLLTSTYLLRHWLELARLVLVATYFLGLCVLTWRLNLLNAGLLVNIPPDEGII